MTDLHIAGTFYVPEGRTVTLRLPSVREGNDSSRVWLFSNRGEVYLPAYIDEADTDDVLLLNQYSADRIVESIRAAVEYGDVDPSEGVWKVTRTDHGLDVDHELVDSASEAM